MLSDRTRRIATLGLPIVGGMVSQNVLNLVDTAMVGSLGSDALAAVSTASFTAFMCTAFITGLSSGVQALAARRVGEGNTEEVAVGLNGGLLLSLLLGIPASIALIVLAPIFYPLVNGDPKVIELAVPYLQVRLAATVFLGMNFAFRGHWNGIDRSALYMRTLVVMHIINVLISGTLIFGWFGAPELGTLGAAIGTSASLAAGTAMYFWLGFRESGSQGFLAALPSREFLGKLLKLAAPTSVQQTMFAAGFTVLMAIVGAIGTGEVAAAGVLINVTLVAILPGLALGLASSTLVGQALGRNDPDDAYQWGVDVVRGAFVGIGLLGLPMLVVPELLLSPFLREPEVLALATTPLRISGALISFDAVGMVLMHSLIGAGAVRSTAAVAVGAQWLVALPLAYLVGPVGGLGLTGVWAVQVGQRVGLAGIFAVLWRRGAWRSIRI